MIFMKKILLPYGLIIFETPYSSNPTANDILIKRLKDKNYTSFH